MECDVALLDDAYDECTTAATIAATDNVGDEYYLCVTHAQTHLLYAEREAI